MCALMSLIAPEELRVEKARAVHFLESYIGWSLSDHEFSLDV